MLPSTLNVHFFKSVFHSQGEISLDTEDEEDFGGLLDTEREFDVNEILKVNNRLLSVL